MVPYGGISSAAAQSRDMLDAALGTLLTTASKYDALRSDDAADDVLINLSGIALSAGQTSQREHLPGRYHASTMPATWQSGAAHDLFLACHCQPAARRIHRPL